MMRSMRINIGIGIGRRGGAFTPPAITQVTPPTFGPYVAGDTPEDGYVAGTYTSTEGDIVSVSASWTINSTLGAGDAVLIEGDVVGLTVTVADDQANERLFNYGTQTVPYLTITASGTVPEQEWRIGVPTTLAMADYFTGGTITNYGVSSGSLPPGVSLDLETGVLTINATTEQSLSEVVIFASNPAGSATQAVDFVVIDGPLLTLESLVDNVLEVAASELGTLYWAFSVAPITTGAAIEAGTGATTFGDYEVEAGANSDEVTAPTGPFEGFFQAVLKDATDRYSNIISDDVDIEASGPIYPEFVALESGTGTTITIPAAVEANDLIVIFVDNDAATNPDLSSGYTNNVLEAQSNSRLRIMSKTATGSETTETSANTQRWHAAIYRHHSKTPVVGNLTIYKEASPVGVTIPANTPTATDGTSIIAGVWHKRGQGTAAQRAETITGMTTRGSRPASGTASSLVLADTASGVASFSVWTSTNTGSSGSVIGAAVEIGVP